KPSASVLTISECQALETLSRDMKTASRTLTQSSERLRGDEETQQANKSEVRVFPSSAYPTCLLYTQSSLPSRGIMRSKQEYESQQSERTRIRYCFL
ncbi:hypothetical protein F4604DRAFT_1515355, partial [Suillus subluteus]